jgi:hypothetical protein
VEYRLPSCALMSTTSPTAPGQIKTGLYKKRLSFSKVFSKDFYKYVLGVYIFEERD